MKKLTKRQMEILKLFCYQNKEIANILTLEISTVKTHVSQILKKMKARNKVSALVKAIQSGVINIFDVKTNLRDVGFWDVNGEYHIDMTEVNNE